MPGKRSTGLKAALQIYLVCFLALLVLAAVGAGYLLYVVHIPMPQGGQENSAWPKRFTEAFAAHIVEAEGAPVVDAEGIALLRAHGLWCQVLGATGDQVFAYGKDTGLPDRYDTDDLLRIAGGATEDGAVFLGSYRLGSVQGQYLVGFPVRIAIVSMYLNGDRFTSGRTVLPIFLGCAFLCVALAGLGYGAWMARRMRRVADAVEEIAARTYAPRDEGGLWGELTGQLNRLDEEIRAGDQLRDATDRLREEWIADITHDLKTPLAPIRGYAELLSDAYAKAGPEEVRAYAHIMRKHVGRMEQLLDDMKLMYQIEGGIVPLRLERVNVARQLKEIVIDRLNAPEIAEDAIHYESGREEAWAMLDAALFRRAIENLLTNAFVHNPAGTQVTVSLACGEDINISITDTGQGIAQEDLPRLFDRYVRGGGGEGTGLGLAITREIVTLHGGTLAAESVTGQGTKVFLTLPKDEN